MPTYKVRVRRKVVQELVTSIEIHDDELNGEDTWRARERLAIAFARNKAEATWREFSALVKLFPPDMENDCNEIFLEKE